MELFLHIFVKYWYPSGLMALFKVAKRFIGHKIYYYDFATKHNNSGQYKLIVYKPCNLVLINIIKTIDGNEKIQPQKGCEQNYR